jgi:hypothetical protein
VTPFAVLGGGILGALSNRDAVGIEADAALHVGAGLKYFISDDYLLRLEVRDVISPKLGDTETPAHSPEVLLSFGFRFDARPPKPPAPPPTPDRDADGMADDVDHCPWDPGPAWTQGCPVPDSDCDGVPDDTDACPREAGDEGKGCPVPELRPVETEPEAEAEAEAEAEPEAEPDSEADSESEPESDSEAEPEPESEPAQAPQ